MAGNFEDSKSLERDLDEMSLNFEQENQNDQLPTIFEQS
jgi:hypothetical protein